MRQNRKLNSEEAQVEIPARGAGTAHQRRPSGTMAPVWNKRRLPHHLPVVHDRARGRMTPSAVVATQLPGFAALAARAGACEDTPK
jgi:hypothetical protein